MDDLNWVLIRNQQVIKNGELFFETNETKNTEDFLLALYQHLASKYSKFYKMDALAKGGCLATDILLQSVDNISENTALIFSNRNASLLTDQHYVDLKKSENVASPALFVYTLPNIVLGEIAIKHKLLGENAFFVFPEFRAVDMLDYVKILIENEAIESVLCGWVEVSEKNADIFLYLANSSNLQQLNNEYIDNLYNLKK